MYYIDGNNLEGNTHPQHVGTPAAERELIQLLDRYANEQGKDITLVFDGVRPAARPRGRLIIVFPTPEDGDADNAIIRLLNRDPQVRSAIVVTGDRGLIDRVRAVGAKVMPKIDFLDKISPVADREVKPKVASGQEVDEWLRVFGISAEQAKRGIQVPAPPELPRKPGKKLK